MVEKNKLEIVAVTHFMCSGIEYDEGYRLKQEEVPVIIQNFNTGFTNVLCPNFAGGKCEFFSEEEKYRSCPYKTDGY